MSSDPAPLDQLAPADVEPLVGQQLRGDDGTAFTLAGVRRLPDVGQPRPEPFALDLTRPGPVAEQGIVRLHHDALGVLEVFAVPVGRDGDLVRYEVLFN